MIPERLTRGLGTRLRRLAPLTFKEIDPIRLVDLGCLISLPSGYFPTNPSIVQAFDMLIFCVRGVNYELNNIGPLAYQFTIGSTFHSKNRVAILDPSFEHATPLNHLSLAFDNVHDIKLFTDQGKLCAIGSRQRSDQTAEMVIYTISR